MSAEEKLYIAKEFLKAYHEKVKRLALEQKYKALGIYELDADGEIVYEADGVTPKKKPATIVEAINDKLSKYDVEKFDASLLPFNKD